MRGDVRLGALVRSLRTARHLTLAAVADRIGCAESLLSQVETGARTLRPWLAEALDIVFGVGGTISALAAAGADAGTSHHHGKIHHRAPDADVILVRVPQRGIAVPVSRRELLSALGIGAVGGSLLSGMQHALASVRPDEQLLTEFNRTLQGLQTAGRVMPPTHVVGPLTGYVGLIDAIRRRAPAPLEREFVVLQARYAESLSWMAEESGDLWVALYWTDRAQHWAHLAGWQSMVAYAHVRRSMLAVSHASDGRAAVEHAQLALRIPNLPPRIRGLAAKQLAYGYALARQADASKRALDLTIRSFAVVDGGAEDGPLVGQRSVNDPDLLAIYQATCDVYLGGADSVITTLEPRMGHIARGSGRTRAITAAKLAQAYARVGEAGVACALMMDTLDAATAIESLTTRTELCRALPPLLARWPDRGDVREVQQRLRDLGPTGA